MLQNPPKQVLAPKSVEVGKLFTYKYTIPKDQSENIIDSTSTCRCPVNQVQAFLRHLLQNPCTFNRYFPLHLLRGNGFKVTECSLNYQFLSPYSHLLKNKRLLGNFHEKFQEAFCFSIMEYNNIFAQKPHELTYPDLLTSVLVYFFLRSFLFLI